jgi:hypothetical protein
MRLWALLIGLAGCSGVFGDPGRGELVAYGNAPTWLAISGSELYYVSSGSNQQHFVMRVSKFPGGSAELVAAGDVITAITADERGVYWLETSGGTTHVRAWSQGDSTPRDLGTNPTFAQGSSLRNLVSDGDNIFYADYTGTVWRVPITGTGFVEVGKTDTSAGSIALAPNGDVWVSSIYGVKVLRMDGTSDTNGLLTDKLPSSIAFDDNKVFVSYSGSGAEDGSVLSFALINHQVTTLARELVLPVGMVASGGELYFVTGNSDAAVRAVAYDGGGAEPLAIGHGPASVVVDESFAYWSDPYPGEIRRSPRAP